MYIFFKYCEGVLQLRLPPAFLYIFYKHMLLYVGYCTEMNMAALISIYVIMACHYSQLSRRTMNFLVIRSIPAVCNLNHLRIVVYNRIALSYAKLKRSIFSNMDGNHNRNSKEQSRCKNPSYEGIPQTSRDFIDVTHTLDSVTKVDL